MSDNWYKSSYSTATGENCVEVANLHTSIAVRDSQHPHEGRLLFPTTEWRAFLTALDEL